MNYFKKTSTLSLILSLFYGISFAVNEAPAQKKLVDKIVAVVNQDIILYSEYETFKKGMEDEFRKGADKDKEVLNHPETFQKKVLDQMIENKLMEQEVRTLGLEATDSQLENVVSEIMKNNGLQSRKDLDRALRGEGVTYDEFISEYKKRIGRSNLVNQTIRPKIKISDDEILSEFKKRTKTAAQEMQYQVAMILISKKNISAKDMEKVRKSISSISDFTKVANEKTEGPGGAKGGEIGWVDPSDLQPPLNEAIKKMKKGMISAILESDAGYYILACLDSKSKATAEETKIKGEIQEDIMNTLITKNLNQYIADLKRKSHIETYL